MELNELAIRMMDEEEAEERFDIDNDEKADWAVRKVLEAYEERDRLLALVGAERVRLTLKETEINDNCEAQTAYLLQQLEEYMNSGIKVHTTDTQKTYKLLNGTLRYKKPKVDVSAGDGLTDWIKSNRPDLLRVKEEVDWAKVKKLVKKVGDGCFTLADSGEIVDGIVEKELPGKFEVKE